MSILQVNQEELARLLVELIATIGFWKALIGVVVIFLLFTAPKSIATLIDSWKVKKQTKLERDKLEFSLEERDKFFKSIEELIIMTNESAKALYLTLEKMQVSVSIKKFELLKESFLGINRTFVDSFKFRLLTHYENPKFDTIVNVKNEIRQYYVEKVINKLLPFILKDEAFSNNVKNEGLMIINTFIEVSEFIFIDRGLPAAKEFLESEGGLSKLNVDISHMLTKEYSSLISKDLYMQYLRNLGR